MADELLNREFVRTVLMHEAPWRKERGAALAQAFVPLSFAPGEAYQFDWSHEIVLMNGVTMTVKVAHLRLCHSRMFIAGPIRARRRRWCSTRMSAPSPSSRAPARAESTTT